MFGKRLKELRKQSRKSQTEVANEITARGFEMAQTYLSALENRDTAPREDLLRVLADYFNVPITYFYEREPEPTGVELAKTYLREARYRAQFDLTDVDELDF